MLRAIRIGTNVEAIIDTGPRRAALRYAGAPLRPPLDIGMAWELT